MWDLIVLRCVRRRQSITHIVLKHKPHVCVDIVLPVIGVCIKHMTDGVLLPRTLVVLLLGVVDVSMGPPDYARELDDSQISILKCLTQLGSHTLHHPLMLWGCWSMRWKI